MHGAEDRLGIGSAVLAAGLLAVCAGGAVAQSAVELPLDPIQQAVIESIESSLKIPGGNTPAALLEAAVRAADIEASAAAESYLGRLAMAADKAGDDAPTLLADLAESVDNVSLARLASIMDKRQPAASRLVRVILSTGRLRRRDPARLEHAAANLASGDRAQRERAAEQLARVGVDALPVLVPLLPDEAGDDEQAIRQSRLARELVARLGNDARQPLIDWLATGDLADQAAVIEALDVSGATDIEDFLLAPAFVANPPPTVRAAALRALERRAAVRGADLPPPMLSTDAVIARLTGRLDRLLMPEGVPSVDCLAVEPISDPAGAAAAFGGDVAGTVERRFWNPKARQFDLVKVPPRVARAREAMVLARSLEALDARDEQVIDLVLLTRLETALVTSGKSLPEIEQLPADLMRETLAGPEGFRVESAGRVFEQAILRGMWPAAAAAAKAIVPQEAPVIERAGSEAALSPGVRDALVRALAVPDAAVQFAAARTLALAAGEPPYRGSSRVREVLLHAATSIGSDRVVVAHPLAEVAHELATGLTRFGYEPVVVSSGRQAVFAARESADTVLVVLGSRIAHPTALETTQFLQQQPLGDMPAILVVIDPLDDHGRGCYLTRLVLSFRGFERVAITDRLESLLWPSVSEAGSEVPPRFPDVVAQAAGPVAVDPASRNAAAAARLGRAREALLLLGDMAQRGWDVAPAADTAQRGLLRQELYAPAVALLADLGTARAQSALEQENLRADLPDHARTAARTAFKASVDRWGILLKSGQMLEAYARYNSAADDTSRGAAGDILDVLEAAGKHAQSPSSDASSVRSRQ
jgi:hypothetical protein